MADENTAYLELKDGRVTIKLRPDIAPKHVARVKELVSVRLLGQRDALVQHLDHRQCDLGPAAGVAVCMDVDPPRKRRTDVLNRCGLADPRRVVVDQLFLEFLLLLVAEHGLGELADAGVGAVHDLPVGQLLFQHGPADLDPLQCFGG